MEAEFLPGPGGPQLPAECLAAALLGRDQRPVLVDVSVRPPAVANRRHHRLALGIPAGWHLLDPGEGRRQALATARLDALRGPVVRVSHGPVGDGLPGARGANRQREQVQLGGARADRRFDLDPGRATSAAALASPVLCDV